MPPPNIGRYGLTQVHAPIGGGQVDVVFVHGLNGNPHNTWTAEQSKIFWPAELLPPILEEEEARILVYGYDADVTSFTDGASKDAIHNHAEHLVAQLAANRRIRKATERPIIFVAHSLGGLVVKRALIYSSEIRGNHTEHLRSVFVSTYAILFLGTPHKGADLAKWGSRLEAIASAVMPSKVVDSNEKLVNALKKDNETLQVIDRQFIQIINRFHVYFFHEGKPTNLKGTMRYIVDEESASPTVQDVERALIQADHSHMCKFESDSSPGFDLVAEGIQRYAGDASDMIVARWTAEKAGRLVKKKAEVEELAGAGSVKLSPNTASSTSTSTPTPDTSQILPPKSSPQMQDDATNTSAGSNKPLDPYFIVPPGFRPNTFFIGFEKEFAELDKQLFGRRRRDGTACVLLWGQPGGGKSHLARQYVNKKRRKFGGGVFWIPARSDNMVRQAFSLIKQKVITRDSPDFCNGVGDNSYISSVKVWFQQRQEWLIVFDGVAVESDEETRNLAKFIPDSKNSSIIYISRAKNLESKQRLLRPIPIKVGPLKSEEAKKLLFKELHIKKPSEAENKKATELVKRIGGLPLAINAISHRLADTHEPLTKYKLSYSGNSGLESTYNQILDDLQRLDHMEAWNLINTLCWFAQDLPFEMVNLGLKILRAEKVEVRITDGTGKRDIDNTIAVLMRYALIERNEPDQNEAMSSSRDSLNEPEPIDMLKVHTVVQNFCCEQQKAKGILPLWLGHAVRLFSYSYHQADVRIKMKPEPGRVSDYRYYETHAKWLWNNTFLYQTKAQSLESIRDFLSPTIQRISEEIREREPSSSQESLGRGIFQISIFDRTSSSSDSGPKGPLTPDTRPTPPPLAGETDFGFPIGKQIDSPASFGTASPGIRPRIVGNSPRLPLDEDFGYVSDREGEHNTPMQRNISEMTAMPPARSRAPTTESHGGEWQVVQKLRKQPHGRRDLGSFRPSRTPARVQVNKQNVNASIPRSSGEQKENRRESSPAFESLEKVHSQSPPPSRGGVASLLRNPFNRPTTSIQPSWAGIAAGAPRPPPQQNSTAALIEKPTPSPASMLMDRGRSHEAPTTRPGSTGVTQPSPLASSFAPGYPQITDPRTNPTFPIGNPPAGFHSSLPYPGSSNLPQPPQSRLISTTPSTAYYTPQNALGANPSPLAYDQITTTKRPLPTDFTSPPQPLPTYSAPPSLQHSPPSHHTSPHQQTSPYPQPSPYPPQPSSAYPPVILPSGYTSQPMSRNHSQFSHNSMAETEPPNMSYNPSAYSPQMLGTSLPPDSPRERYPDGRPFRKSPKTDFAVPTPYSQSYAHSSPSYTYQPQQQQYSARTSPQYDLSHAGGWAMPDMPPDPDSSLATAGGMGGTSMSRSSSGPGIAVEGGIIGFANPREVQFGGHTVSVEEARRRVEEHERRLREEGRRRSATEGRGMKEGEGVGLGVHMG